MAEYRTLTGEFSLRGVVQDVTGDSCEFQSGNMKMGRDTDYNDHRVFATLTGGDASDETLSASTIKNATLTISVKKESTTTTNTRLYIYFYNKSVGTYSAQVLFSALNGGQSSYATSILDENTTSSQTTSVVLAGTNAANVKNYGVGFTTDGNDIVRLESVSIEYTIVDEKVPPTLGLSFPNGKMVNGTYYHDPHKSFLMQASYSQVANAPMEKMTFKIYTNDAHTSYYTLAEITDVSEAVTWYPDWGSFYNQQWIQLPRSGAIGICAKPEGEYYSDDLIVPFVIAESVVKITSPTSGSVVKSNEDIVLSFSIEPPPELPTMERPDAIWVWTGYDGEHGDSGKKMSGDTFTMGSGELAGHESVNFSISTEYRGATGEDGNSDLDVYNASYKDILATYYIQQVAGTGNVTVNGATTKAYIVSVSWESTGQTAYQVRVGSYTSEIVWGNDTLYYVPFVLETGVMYPVQVRIQSTQGEWTDWTEPVYVTPQSPLFESKEGIRVTVEDGFSTVEIAPQIDNLTNYTTVLLYRDGVPIATFDVAEKISYTDVGANGETTYSVACARFYSTQKQGLAGFLAPVTIDATPSTDGLVLSDKTWLPLRYTTDEIKYGGSASEEVYQRYYSGRSYPVVMRSGRKTETLTLSYADPTGELADTLIEQVGTTVLFKNRDGLKFWGCLESVTPTRHLGWCEVSLTLRKVDVNEWVPLIWGEKT